MRAFVLVSIIATAAAQYIYVPSSEATAEEDLASRTTDESTLSNKPVEELYEKSFYSYIAPEQDLGDTSAVEQLESTLKKNLRVIFIKGPENTALENGVLQLAKSAGDDRTAIYVLNKQIDISALADQVQQIKANNTNKPEINFIKYRTQADAENAQRAIQAQYDNVPGVTTNNNASSAPVLDFSSKSVKSSNVIPTASSRRGFTPPRNSYLPSSKRL